jgi:hypothetical protein
MATLQHKLVLHDVHDAEASIRQTLNEYLQRRGAWLNPHDYDSALQYLLDVVWRESLKYDPGRGLKFRTILNYRVRQRIVDWYRTEKHDDRAQFKPELLSISNLDEDDGESGFEERVLGELALG